MSLFFSCTCEEKWKNKIITNWHGSRVAWQMRRSQLVRENLSELLCLWWGWVPFTSATTHMTEVFLVVSFSFIGRKRGKWNCYLLPGPFSERAISKKKTVDGISPEETQECENVSIVPKKDFDTQDWIVALRHRDVILFRVVEASQCTWTGDTSETVSKCFLCFWW